MTKTQTRAPAVFAPVTLTVKAQARRDALRNLSAYVDERMSQREWQEMWDAEHTSDEYRSAYRYAVRRLMEAGGDGR